MNHFTLIKSIEHRVKRAPFYRALAHAQHIEEHESLSIIIYVAKVGIVE